MPTSSRIRQHHGEYPRACLTYAELVSWQNLLILLFFYFIYLFFFYFFTYQQIIFYARIPIKFQEQTRSRSLRYKIPPIVPRRVNEGEWKVSKMLT